jgi:hypothetical protein
MKYFLCKTEKPVSYFLTFIVNRLLLSPPPPPTDVKQFFHFYPPEKSPGDTPFRIDTDRAGLKRKSVR